MPETIEGTITDTFTKNVGPGGKYTVHMITVETTKGKPEYVNCGFKNPGLKLGDFVNIPVDWKYGEWQVPNPKKGATDISGSSDRDNSTNKSHSSPGGPSSTGKNPAFPVPIDSREQAIIRQNALSNAVNMVTSMPIDAQATDDDYIERIIHVAYEFTAFSSGKRERDAAAKMDPTHKSKDKED